MGAAIQLALFNRTGKAPDHESLCATAEEIGCMDYDAMHLGEVFNRPVEDSFSEGKRILWSDILLNSSRTFNGEIAGKFRSAAGKIQPLIDRADDWSPYYRFEKAVFETAALKCELLVHLRRAYIETDKKCLIYRNISKKFNEAIQLKLFMKTKDEDAEFYKKCFLILNKKCHKYFNDNIYPYLINADTVYQFFSFGCEDLFNKLFNYSFNELKSIIISNNLKLNININKLQNSFKKTIIRFLVTMIKINFEKEDYDSLNFSELALIMMQKK